MTKAKRNKRSAASEISLTSVEGLTTDEALALSPLIETLEHETEEVHFTGEATLNVIDGAVIVNGFQAQQGAEIEIAADHQIGGPLLIRAAASSYQPDVPLEPKAIATFKLTSREQSLAGIQIERAKSFEVAKKKLAAHGSTMSAPDHWEQAAQEVAADISREGTGIVAVAGTKGIGKSSFARHLVNILLRKFPSVAYLDTDLGQPEFTVPGLVSLHLLDQPILGPPHMHQRPPQFSQYLGDVSPQSDPEQCSLAVQKLCQCYQYQMLDSEPDSGLLPPLVVNTHGWIQGVGLDYLSTVLSAARPSHVLMLQSTNVKRNLPAYAFWLEQAVASATAPPPKLLAVPGISSHSQALQPEGSETQERTSTHGLPAVEVRSLSWLAFARRCCSDSSRKGSCDASTYAAAAEAMTRWPPFVVKFADIKIQVLYTHVSEQHLSQALNGSLVGLATTKLPNSDPPYQDSAHGPPVTRCVGVGYIRGIDAEQGLLYLLTDVCQEDLQVVNVLQLGRQSLPPSLMQTATSASPFLSFWSLSSGGSGSGVIKSRNTLPRASHAALA